MEQNEFEEALKAQVAAQPEEAVETPEVPDEPEAEAQAAEEVVEEPSPYPEDVQRFLQKYDGDISKALEAAVHSQRLIGEQGNELGELRRMVQDLHERQPEKPAPSPFVPEGVGDAIMDNPEQVAYWAIQNENPHVYEAAMAEWYDQDARAASRFERQLEREMLKQELRAEVQPEIENVRTQTAQRAVVDAHRSLSQKYPDFQQVLETATEQELAGIDRDLLSSLQETNPQAALEIAYRWVSSGRAGQQAQAAAERTEQGREEKRQAAVVTSGSNNTSDPEPTVMERLKASMLTPDPVSIHHNLVRE